MIPKILVKDHGHGYSAHYPAVPAVIRPPEHFVNSRPPEHYVSSRPSEHFVGNHLGYVPANVVIQAQNDIDSLLQVHRRKMLRRAANRRSAQLSRARKKAHMEDLKVENTRLQRLVDVLDSQPELVFCVNSSGKITHMSERASIFLKSSEDGDEDATHIHQILSPESVDAVMESLTQLKNETRGVNEQEGSGNIAFVKYVCYNDANGFQVVGYLRCARLFRRAPYDENAADAADIMCPPPAKKGKRSEDPKMQLTAASLAEVAYNSHGGCNPGPGPSSSSSSQRADFLSTVGGRSIADYSEDASKMRAASSASLQGSSSSQHPTAPSEEEEEFVCSIRPADASVPTGAGGQSFNTLLSTASMVAHDRGHLRTNHHTSHSHGHGHGHSHHGGRAGDDGNTVERRGSPSGSSGSINSSVEGGTSSDSCKKNSTSSETGSDDNGETESL